MAIVQRCSGWLLSQRLGSKLARASPVGLWASWVKRSRRYAQGSTMLALQLATSDINVAARRPARALPMKSHALRPNASPDILENQTCLTATTWRLDLFWVQVEEMHPTAMTCEAASFPICHPNFFCWTQSFPKLEAFGSISQDIPRLWPMKVSWPGPKHVL